LHKGETGVEPASSVGLGDRMTNAMIAIRMLMQARENPCHALASIDPRPCRVVELRFFAGPTTPETADALEVSNRNRRARMGVRKSVAAAAIVADRMTRDQRVDACGSSGNICPSLDV
jgi:hypothetical protein